MENVYVAAFSAASAAVAVVAVVFVAITDAPPWHAAPYLTFIIVDVFLCFRLPFRLMFAVCVRQLVCWHFSTYFTSALSRNELRLSFRLCLLRKTT